MTIQNDTVVTIHYHLTNADGEVLDSSRGSEPLTYLHGAGNIVPGLERALMSLDVGATTTVQLAPIEAYGEYNADMVQHVPQEALAEIEDLEIGMQLQAQDPNGQTFVVYVTEIRDDVVVVDANHPLAGVDLTFDIEIVDVRDATTEELSHGHVHSPGGHHE
jgi:FKBP-type peptidyl-prolyl cis-trans isomerase SlyD